MFLFFGKVRESLGKGGGGGEEAGNSESSTQAAFPSVPNYLFGGIKGRFASNRDLLQLITVNRGRVEEVEVSLKDNIDNIMDEFYPQHECTSRPSLINSRFNH